MSTPLSAEAWSNWGHNYPDQYYYAGNPQQQQGQGGYNYSTGQYGSQYQSNPLYQPPGMPTQSGGYGTTIGMPSQVPTSDPNYWQQYMYPAALAAQTGQTAVGTRIGTATGMENIAGGLIDKYGLQTPTEATPSMRAKVKQNMADSFAKSTEYASRSGMPISSVAAKGQAAATQQGLESLTRADYDAWLASKQQIADLLKTFSR